MLKKIFALAVASLTIVALTVFSLSSVLAQDQSSPPMPQGAGNNGFMQSGPAQPGTPPPSSPASAPLSSPRDVCREARTNYSRQVRDIRAKGLSTHLSQQEINDNVRAVTDYRNQVCNVARPLTSPRDICLTARRNYSNQVRDTRAKGLSMHLTRQEINQALRDIRDYRDRVCVEAQGSHN